MRADARAVEARLEPAFAEAFGRPIDIIVRDGAAWPALMAGNPFPEAAALEPARVAVRVMRAPLPDGAEAGLALYVGHGERVAVAGGDLWVHLPEGFAPSRVPGAITPKRMGSRDLPQLEHGAKDRRGAAGGLSCAGPVGALGTTNERAAWGAPASGSRKGSRSAGAGGRPPLRPPSGGSGLRPLS